MQKIVKRKIRIKKEDRKNEEEIDLFIYLRVKTYLF